MVGNKNGNEVMGMGGSEYTKVIPAHLYSLHAHVGDQQLCTLNSLSTTYVLSRYMVAVETVFQTSALRQPKTTKSNYIMC